MQILLSGSVGAGGKNEADDVERVQQRLIGLGFSFVGQADGEAGSKTERTIKLFQSIKSGRSRLGGDGRIDVGGDTHSWLEAGNSPQWQSMPASGPGFVNVEAQDTSDKHDFGTNWLADTITAAALEYSADYLSSHTASPLTVNDASLPAGGDTPDHGGHETRPACDLRLPKIGSSGAAPGGRTVDSSDYDVDATRAILLALRAQPLCSLDRMFLNDQILIAEGLCRFATGHANHIHFEVQPPERQA